MDSTASPPPTKIARLRPRQSLCEYSAYQCDRPCYMRTRFCDAHICEMQTLRSVGTVSNHEADDAAPSVKNGNTAQLQQPAVIQCQYRVRRYERRCKNPVPSDGGDVHFCSEHRARVATRRDGSGGGVSSGGQSSGAATETALKEALNGASGATPATVSPTAVAEAVVSDYVRLPQRWLSSTRRPVEVLEALCGLPPVPGPGLPMPRTKDERGEWKEDWDSDAESPASDDEDKFESIRNAGVYTVNEMLIHAMFHRRKLMLLYQEHMAAMRRILQHEHAVYEEVRNNHKQMRTATNTIIMRGRQAEIFRALRKFKRYAGVESLVHEKSKRIRLRSVCPDKLKPSANPQRCAYNDPTKDEKCPERVLPLSKYCPKHILHQPNQCLFERCHIDRCDQPVLRVAKEENREDNSGEARVDPEKLCSTHRPAESIADWLPPDMSRTGLSSQLSGRASPPRPPPDAVTAAKMAAAAPLVSPEKLDAGTSSERMLLKREDSMSLQESFELNLFMINEEDMLDPKLMEEALSVLHQSDGLEPSPNSTLVVGNTSGSSHGVGPVVSGVVPGVPVSGPGGVPGGAAWAQHMEDIVDVVLRDSRAGAAVGESAVSGVGPGVSSAGDLHMGELWPGDLDPLSEVWEGLVAADAAIEQRKAESSGSFERGDVAGSQTDPDAAEEEIVEVEVEQVDLEAPGQCAVLAELQALDQADQAAANSQDCKSGSGLVPQQSLSHMPSQGVQAHEFPVADEPPVIGVPSTSSSAVPAAPHAFSEQSDIVPATTTEKLEAVATVIAEQSEIVSDSIAETKAASTVITEPSEVVAAATTEHIVQTTIAEKAEIVSNVISEQTKTSPISSTEKTESVPIVVISEQTEVTPISSTEKSDVTQGCLDKPPL